MSVTPRLSRKLHETLGDDAAEDLVSWMQDRETHHGDLRAEMQVGFARVDARFSELRETLRGDIAELRQEMIAGNAALRHEITTGVAALRHAMSDTKAELMKWSLLFWIGAVGAIAGLAFAVR